MRSITPAELFDRFRQRAWAGLETWNAFRRQLAPDVDQALMPGVRPEDALAEISRLLPLGSRPGHAVRPAPRDERELARLADNALGGRFDLLGLKDLDFGRPVDWHLEPTHGKRCPLLPWKRLDTLATDASGDKKVVWELNRHQHLVILARAAGHFGDPRYGQAIIEDISAWIRGNPPALGINWVSSLELAFRSMSWLWAISLLDEPTRCRLPAADVCASLHAQGMHVERFLSTYSSPNTHLTGEALGLYFLGTCLPGLRRATRWRQLGRSILVGRLGRHVRPDGVYFEQSTWYHRYTADFYLHFYLLAAKSGDALAPAVRERLEALLEHLMWISRPDGTFPLVGDDDGGRLAALEERHPLDWRALLASGAAVFGRGDFKHVAAEFSEESHWLLGTEGGFAGIEARKPDGLSRAFKEGGYFVMRSGWRSDSHYLLVDCGPLGTMNCGHAHADALAIEIAAHGVPMVVDPGTFTYSSPVDQRDRFRSSPAHSALFVDGESSSVPAGPFQWRHMARCRLDRWHDHPSFTYFEGHHDGYCRLADPVAHARCLLFAGREYWVLVDGIEAAGAHDYGIAFQAAAGTQASLDPAGRRLELRRGTAVLDVFYPGQQGEWHIGEERVSSCFGASEPAPRGVFHLKGRGALSMLAVIVPRKIGSSPATIEPVASGRGAGVRVVLPARRDLVIRGCGAIPGEGLEASDFEWAWVRRERVANAWERAVFLHGTHARLDGLDVRLESPVDHLAIRREQGGLVIDVSPPVRVALEGHPGAARVSVNGGTHLLRAD